MMNRWLYGFLGLMNFWVFKLGLRVERSLMVHELGSVGMPKGKSTIPVFFLTFTSIPEERYDEYRQSSDFIKEYIFPGGCLPSLAGITSAMATSSRLRKIISLGFNDKFIRTWEYYFDYCAAGFKTHTLGNYQVVFSRPGNVVALSNPYKSSPSAY